MFVVNMGRFRFHKGGKKLSSIIWPAGAAKTGCKNTKNVSQYGNEGEVPTYKLFKKKLFGLILSKMAVRSCTRFGS